MRDQALVEIFLAYGNKEDVSSGDLTVADVTHMGVAFLSSELLSCTAGRVLSRPYVHVCVARARKMLLRTYQAEAR